MGCPNCNGKGHYLDAAGGWIKCRCLGLKTYSVLVGLMHVEEPLPERYELHGGNSHEVGVLAAQRWRGKHGHTYQSATGKLFVKATEVRHVAR